MLLKLPKLSSGFLEVFLLWSRSTAAKLSRGIFGMLYSFLKLHTKLLKLKCTVKKSFCLSHQISNKRPMGHIAHLRKQFKSINMYGYIITLIKKRRKKTIINFMRIYFFFIWRNLNPLHPRMLCAETGWNWLSGSVEEDFLIS